jgi:hypothetical protein
MQLEYSLQWEPTPPLPSYRYVVMQLEYSLQWEDERLWSHPCYGALPSMLSLGREAGRSDQARYV